MPAIYESLERTTNNRLSTAHWSFLAGAGTVLLAWWIQDRRYRQRRAGWEAWLRDDKDAGQDELTLTEEGKNPSCIYLDYNGTTPITSVVLKAMMPYFTTHFGNPSSGHAYGKEPARAMDRARVQILTLLGKPSEDPSSIWFTACGTESDNMAIQCALRANAHRFETNGHRDQDDDKNDTEKKLLPHIVTSNVEHPAIEAYLQYLEQGGECTVTYVPVQSDGRVRAADVIAAIRPDGTTILVTLMRANNETGALQPVAAVAHHCRQAGILFHTDAAQAAGKVSVELDSSDGLGEADMVTLVGHKLGAPKGVACLYVRPGCLSSEEAGRRLPPGAAILLHGGGQEFGRRAGTPNVPYIVGFGKAAAEAAKHWPQNAKHMAAVRAYLLEQLQELLGKQNVKANGPIEPHLRLPNTLSVGIKGIHAGQLLQAVSHMVAASAGAACHGTNDVSAVLRAMQVPLEFARGTLRLSVGPSTTFHEAERAAKLLAMQCEVLNIQSRIKSP